MAFGRAVAVLGFFLFAAPGAAQPASVRPAVTIPVTAAEIASILESGNQSRSLVLLDAVRILSDLADRADGDGVKTRARLLAALRASGPAPGDTVPLPLPPALWRDVILQRDVPDAELIAAILEQRDSAMLYYGLSALDAETLDWLGRNRALLAELRKLPGTFAAFGRSVRIRDGRVVVPGGEPAAAAWRQVLGADPATPRTFVRALIERDRGRAAFLYDTIAHLDEARTRFALACPLDALAAVFRDFAPEWDVDARPFTRPQLDPSLLLMAVRVDRDGRLAGPANRDLWERVFRDDGTVDLPFREVAEWRASGDGERVDAAWLADRVYASTYTIGRRRLDTIFFAQRALDGSAAAPHVVASVLRAFASMPALMLTLERAGLRDPAVLLAAARHAREIHQAGDERTIAAFQSAVAFVERGVRSRVLQPPAARALVESLAAIPVDRGRGYDARVAAWIRADLFRASPQPPLESTDPVEEAILGLLAGAAADRPATLVEWEGSTYRVDPAAAESARLRRVRELQGGPTLDAAIAALLARDRPSGEAGEAARRDFVAALWSIVYAAYLGDPEGPALAADNVALKHRLLLSVTKFGNRPMNAWKLPNEYFGGADGWRVLGSLLGLDVALRSLALRRLDPAHLPPGPTMTLLERRTAMLTVALANPHALTDEGRDRAAGALARGRARLSALAGDAARLEEILADAAMSEWRREALKWALVHAPGETAGAFSLVETFWLGGGRDLDEWGAAALPMTGCLCLAMPQPTAWENLAGRPSSGLLATLGVDLNLRLADALAARKLPAALLPGVLAFAMQEVLDEARPAFLDDWPAFSRAIRAIADHRIDDYVSALAAGGPLVPVRGTL